MERLLITGIPAELRYDSAHATLAGAEREWRRVRAAIERKRHGALLCSKSDTAPNLAMWNAVSANARAYVARGSDAYAICLPCD